MASCAPLPGDKFLPSFLRGTPSEQWKTPSHVPLIETEENQSTGLQVHSWSTASSWTVCGLLPLSSLGALRNSWCCCSYGLGQSSVQGMEAVTDTAIPHWLVGARLVSLGKLMVGLGDPKGLFQP